MKLIKVGAGVLNQTPLDWENNFQNIINAIEKARNEDVSILCLPELCITGYGCEDAFYAVNTTDKSLEYLQKIVPYTKNMVVTVGLPLLIQNKLFNCACLISDGEILGFPAKKFLAGNGIHYEPRWFTAWTQKGYSHIHIDGHEYKVGDVYFNVSGIKIGFEICEDAWVANRPGRDLYNYGIDIILNPSASHFAFDKLEVRKRFVLEGSRAFGVSYIYANLMGNESGRVIFDGGSIIASNGTLLAIGERLSFEDVIITTAVIDVDLTRLAQIQTHTFDIVESFGNCIDNNFDFPKIGLEKIIPLKTTWEQSENIKEEEFARAMMLGLYDYLRKSRSGGFVISLSGGADSSAIVCLCRMLIDLGIKELGFERFVSKISYIKNIKDLKTADELAKHLITTAYQGTENSGDVTFTAAKELAGAVCAEFHNLNINNIVKEYTKIVAESLGRELSWETDDIALQNIQARVRAPSIWFYANLKNALLLSTSNRSEAAVGYATMDGDTSGGLSPIAGIDKDYLRFWLRWLQNNGVDNAYTIPILSYVNNQQPTAELRPKGAMQTDETDLMPYNILDDIEEAAIRDKRAPLECLQILEVKHPERQRNQLKNYVEKFFQLWCRNQWKRERYAPSFHLDDKNLDPKTWCRFPILSGGFAKELQELRDF